MLSAALKVHFTAPAGLIAVRVPALPVMQTVPSAATAGTLRPGGTSTFHFFAPAGVNA